MRAATSVGRRPLALLPLLVACACAHVMPRRALLRTAAAGAASLAATPLQPSFAFFESKEQVALTQLATVQPKLKGLIAEVAEVKRKRVRMATDTEDDAYVFRFARSVLDPVADQMTQAAPAVKAGRAAELPGEFSASLDRLYTGCRAKDAAAELDALEAAQNTVSEMLELAKSQKLNVAPKGDDINGYEGATPVLYNKFLFRSG